MSDILRAMQKRGVEPVPAVDVITLDGARIFPVPDDDQKVELTKVATRLVEFKPPQWGLVIAMASNVKGEGASFVSYSLARILAMNLGRRVLWIDANFRSPQPQLRHVEDDTLAQYLADPDAPPPKSGANWLSVMPGGLELPSMKAELASERCRQVFDGFRSEYEFIVVDCPPVLESVESAWLGRSCDGLVLVVEARRLKAEIVGHGLRTLREQNVNVLGTVLNKRRFDLPKVVYERV
jgi:Mrp family chromosome partitioning ATPase